MHAPRTLITALSVAVMIMGGAASLVSDTGASASAPAVASTSCPPVTPGALNAAPSVAGAKKTVALTFDDGPGRSTRAIIAVLERFHVRATFFNIGFNIGDYPSLVRLEAADGFLLGDHTNSHPDMVLLSRAAQTQEITQVIDRERILTATSPCVFRPPYGDFDATTMSIAHAYGLSLWMWSDSGGDWLAKGSGSAHWIDYVERESIAGSMGESHPVLLLHNQTIAMPATVAALPAIIKSFQHRGYTFVDLLGRTGPPGVCGAPGAPTPVPTYTVLANGASLASGASLTSPNGQFILTMRSDGRLTLDATDGTSIWSSPTSGNPGAVATVANGQLTVTSASHQSLWSTSTGVANADLHVDSDGVLSLVNGTNVAWTSGAPFSSLHVGDYLKSGWYVSSPDGRCRLEMTSAGALRLLGADGQRLWWNDAVAPNGRTTLEPSGNLVTTDAKGIAWASVTWGHHHDVLTVTNKGTLRLTLPSGKTIWATQ